MKRGVRFNQGICYTVIGFMILTTCFLSNTNRLFSADVSKFIVDELLPVSEWESKAKGISRNGAVLADREISAAFGNLVENCGLRRNKIQWVGLISSSHSHDGSPVARSVIQQADSPTEPLGIQCDVAITSNIGALLFNDSKAADYVRKVHFCSTETALRETLPHLRLLAEELWNQVEMLTDAVMMNSKSEHQADRFIRQDLVKALVCMINESDNSQKMAVDFVSEMVEIVGEIRGRLGRSICAGDIYDRVVDLDSACSEPFEKIMSVVPAKYSGFLEILRMGRMFSPFQSGGLLPGSASSASSVRSLVPIQVGGLLPASASSASSVRSFAQDSDLHVPRMNIMIPTGIEEFDLRFKIMKNAMALDFNYSMITNDIRNLCCLSLQDDLSSNLTIVREGTGRLLYQIATLMELLRTRRGEIAQVREKWSRLVSFMKATSKKISTITICDVPEYEHEGLDSLTMDFMAETSGKMLGTFCVFQKAIVECTRRMTDKIAEINKHRGQQLSGCRAIESLLRHCV